MQIYLQNVHNILCKKTIIKRSSLSQCQSKVLVMENNLKPFAAKEIIHTNTMTEF